MKLMMKINQCPEYMIQYVHATGYSSLMCLNISLMFLRSGVQESPEICCLLKVILRLPSERILALALQQEVCHILHTQTPTTGFYIGDTHTHMQAQSLSAGQH